MAYKQSIPKVKEQKTSYSEKDSTTRLIYPQGKNGQKIKDSGKKIYFEGKELAEVDFTETTAWNNFCRIRFKRSNESYWLPSYRLDL
jgi:hypothetical protein